MVGERSSSKLIIIWHTSLCNSELYFWPATLIPPTTYFSCISEQWNWMIVNKWAYISWSDWLRPLVNIQLIGTQPITRTVLLHFIPTCHSPFLPISFILILLSSLFPSLSVSPSLLHTCILSLSCFNWSANDYTSN